MQAVILAAGKSSRFYPFSTSGHKALLVIMGRTILEHTLLSIKKAGITEVIIVTAPENPFINVLGDGSKLGLHIIYTVQSEPLGMGNALLTVADYLHDDFFLTNANHIDFHEFSRLLENKPREKDSIVLLGKKQQIAGVYGCMQIEGDKVVGFIEKPLSLTQSSLQHVGIYLLNKEYLKLLEKTPLAHDHLEHAFDAYAKQGKVTYVETNKETVTMKYAWDLLRIKDYLLQTLSHSVSKKCDIAKNALLQGTVFIEDGAKIYEGVCIKGPCYIGRNAIVGNNALVRGGSCIEENAVVGAYMEMTNCLLMGNATTHSGFIGDSIIGNASKVGAQFCSANVRLDRRDVAATVKEKAVDSRRNHLGVIIGDTVVIGARVTTMPGILIGNDSLIGPSTTVMENIPDHMKYYTEFSMVRKKKI